MYTSCELPQVWPGHSLAMSYYFPFFFFFVSIAFVVITSKLEHLYIYYIVEAHRRGNRHISKQIYCKNLQKEWQLIICSF